MGDYFTFDSKLFRSLFPLIGKPGHLTNEYNKGKRASYILPLRLYVFTTFLFFFIITVNNKIYNMKLDQETPTEVWVTQDSLENYLAKSRQDLPADEIKNLAYDLDSRFDIIYRGNRNEKSVLDSLKKFLGKINPDTALKNKLATDIFHNFTLQENNKESKKENILSLKEFVDDHPAQIDTITRNSIVTDIDRVYNIKPVKKKSTASRILIAAKSDSTNGSIINYIITKVAKIASRGEEGELLFLAEMFNQVPKVMFLLLPVFALLLKLFYIRRKIFYINHLVFSLHLHTLLFIYLLIPILFSYWPVILFFFIVIWVNTYIAFLNVYQQSKIKTFFKMNVIMITYTFLLLVSVIFLVFLAIFSF